MSSYNQLQQQQNENLNHSQSSNRGVVQQEFNDSQRSQNRSVTNSSKEESQRNVIQNDPENQSAGLEQVDQIIPRNQNQDEIGSEVAAIELGESRRDAGLLVNQSMPNILQLRLLPNDINTTVVRAIEQVGDMIIHLTATRPPEGGNGILNNSDGARFIDQHNRTVDVQDSTFGNTQEAIEFGKIKNLELNQIKLGAQQRGRFRVHERSLGPHENRPLMMSQQNDDSRQSSLEQNSQQNNFASALGIGNNILNPSIFGIVNGSANNIQSSSDNINLEESKVLLSSSHGGAGPFERAKESERQMNYDNYGGYESQMNVETPMATSTANQVDYQFNKSDQSPKTMNISGQHSPLDFDQRDPGRISYQGFSFQFTKNQTIHLADGRMEPNIMMDTPPRKSEQLNSSLHRDVTTVPASQHMGQPNHIFLSNSKSKSYTMQKKMGSERFVDENQDHNNLSSEDSRKQPQIIFSFKEPTQHHAVANKTTSLENPMLISGGSHPDEFLKQSRGIDLDEENLADKEDGFSNQYGGGGQDNFDFASVKSNHSEQRVPAVDPIQDVEIPDLSINQPIQNQQHQALSNKEDEGSNYADAEAEEKESIKNARFYGNDLAPQQSDEDQSQKNTQQIDVLDFDSEFPRSREQPQTTTQTLVFGQGIQDYYPDASSFNNQLMKNSKDANQVPLGILSPQNDMRSDNSQHDVDSQNQSYSMTSINRELKKTRFQTRKISNDVAKESLEPEEGYDYQEINNNSSVHSKHNHDSMHFDKEYIQGSSNKKHGNHSGEHQRHNHHLKVLVSPKFMDQEHEEQVQKIFSPLKLLNPLETKMRNDSEINDIQNNLMEEIIDRFSTSSPPPIKIDKNNPQGTAGKDSAFIDPSPINMPISSIKAGHKQNNEDSNYFQVIQSNIEVTPVNKSRADKLHQVNQSIIVQSPNGRLLSLSEHKDEGDTPTMMMNHRSEVIQPTSQQYQQHHQRKPSASNASQSSKTAQRPQSKQSSKKGGGSDMGARPSVVNSYVGVMTSLPRESSNVRSNHSESQRGESITSLPFNKKDVIEKKGRFQCKTSSQENKEISETQKVQKKGKRKGVQGITAGQLGITNNEQTFNCQEDQIVERRQVNLGSSNSHNYNSEMIDKQNSLQKSMKSFNRLESGLNINQSQAAQHLMFNPSMNSTGSTAHIPIIYHINPYHPSHIYQAGQSPAMDSFYPGFDGSSQQLQPNFLGPQRYQPSYLDSSKNVTYHQQRHPQLHFSSARLNQVNVEEETTDQLNTSRDQRVKITTNIGNSLNNRNNSTLDDIQINEGNTVAEEEAVKKVAQKGKGLVGKNNKKDSKKKKSLKKMGEIREEVQQQPTFTQKDMFTGQPKQQKQGTNNVNPYSQIPYHQQNNFEYNIHEPHSSHLAHYQPYQHHNPSHMCSNCQHSQQIQSQLLELSHQQITMFNNFNQTMNNTVTQILSFAKPLQHHPTSLAQHVFSHSKQHHNHIHRSHTPLDYSNTGYNDGQSTSANMMSGVPSRRSQLIDVVNGQLISGNSQNQRSRTGFLPGSEITHQRNNHQETSSHSHHHHAVIGNGSNEQQQQQQEVIIESESGGSQSSSSQDDSGSGAALDEQEEENKEQEITSNSSQNDENEDGDGEEQEFDGEEIQESEEDQASNESPKINSKIKQPNIIAKQTQMEIIGIERQYQGKQMKQKNTRDEARQIFELQKQIKQLQKQIKKKQRV